MKSFRPWLEPDADILVTFHDSPNEDSFTVDEEYGSMGVNFGGIFAGSNGGMSGEFRHAIILDKNKIARSYDLSYEHDITPILKRLANEDLTEDEMQYLYDVVVEDEFTQNAPDEIDLERIFDTSNPGEASWEGQRLRGLVAKELGYQAVEISDETGTSYLVFPGVKTEPIGDEETYEAEARIWDEYREWEKAQK